MAWGKRTSNIKYFSSYIVNMKSDLADGKRWGCKVDKDVIEFVNQMANLYDHALKYAIELDNSEIDVEDIVTNAFESQGTELDTGVFFKFSELDKIKLKLFDIFNVKRKK
jgi:hypothetical protein